MSFLVDFHIHSHFSIATSKDCDPEHLFLWACLKGINIIGTGDFTHPGWFEELNQKLVPAEEGLFQLHPELEKNVLEQIPKSCHRDVRFILSSEISSIYKKGGKVRKIHNCILVPSMDEARAISENLDRIGNIRADGRPILGLDSHDLLEIMLEESPNGIFIPAHIWTPHFSLFGTYSGFDRLEDCFEDLAPYIWALETGLSSDPPMNWRVSSLDQYILVSNSDAHSPKNLAREANIFNCDLSFQAIRSAIQNKNTHQFLGTVEFFPQEGKYHFDGHRNCKIRLAPEETIDLGGICPKCGKKLTLGVMHRVAALSDRPAGFIPEGAPTYHSLIPLPEILADYFGCRVNSKRVNQAYFSLIQKLGPEWEILMLTPREALEHNMGASLAKGIQKVRSGQVRIEPGFDGEYGSISIFSPKDRPEKQTSLFAVQMDVKKEKDFIPFVSGQSGYESISQSKRKPIPEARSLAGDLNPSQLKAVQASSGPVLVVAGPGTGKTRTLSSRIAFLIKEKGVRPDGILAITFTNKAAKEMTHRLDLLLDYQSLPSRPFIGTFHHFCMDVLKHYSGSPRFILFHTYDSLALMDLIIKNMPNGQSINPRDGLQKISLMKARFNSDGPEADVDPFFLNIYHQYQQGLMKYKALDYDDLIINTVKLLRNDKNVAHKIRSKFKHILVDEFQDVNQAQYSLILLLADEEGKNLFLIGDPNQAIYGFRGADDKLFFQIKEKFPSCQIFSLKDNYRSHASIIDSAQQLISHNPQIIPLNLNSIRGKGPAIRILELPSEKAEGIAIVKEIASLMGGVDMLQAHGESGGKNQSTPGIRQEDYGFSDFAILFRTSNQSDILEECLLKEGIPYRIAGHQSIMENSLIRQILAFLRWCYNPMDEHSLLQSLNLPFLSVTKRDKAKLFQFFMEAPQDIEHHNINEICDISTKFSPQFRTDPRIETLSKAIIQFQQMSKEKTPSEFINQIISILEKDGDIKTHKKDLERLSMMAEEFKNVTSLFDNVSMCREGDMTWKGKKWAEGTEMVNLMTIHAAKGLEFPVVFICGCEADLLPYRYHDKEVNLNEERRLLYVGMTRAKDNLYLSWSKNRIWKGQKQIKQISPFLEEIPEPFFEKTLFTARIPRKPPNKQLGLW